MAKRKDWGFSNYVLSNLSMFVFYKPLGFGKYEFFAFWKITMPVIFQLLVCILVAFWHMS